MSVAARPSWLSAQRAPADSANWPDRDNGRRVRASLIGAKIRGQYVCTSPGRDGPCVADTAAHAGDAPRQIEGACSTPLRRARRVPPTITFDGRSPPTGTRSSCPIVGAAPPGSGRVPRRARAANKRRAGPHGTVTPPPGPDRRAPAHAQAASFGGGAEAGGGQRRQEKILVDA